MSVSRDPSIGGPSSAEPIARGSGSGPPPTRSSTAPCARGGWPTSSTRSRSPASSRCSSRRPERRERAARPRAARRAARGSARPRSRTSSPPSSRCRCVQTAGPALERKADIAAFLTALEPGLGVLHRRDPPPQPRDRGDALSGDGGPPAAGRARPGRRSAHGDPRPAAVHARRRDHSGRAAHDAACATASASATGSSTTTPERPGADRAPLGRDPRGRDRARTASGRSRSARAARPGSPTGC